MNETMKQGEGRDGAGVASPQLENGDHRTRYPYWVLSSKDLLEGEKVTRGGRVHNLLCPSGRSLWDVEETPAGPL